MSNCINRWFCCLSPPKYHESNPLDDPMISQEQPDLFEEDLSRVETYKTVIPVIPEGDEKED